MCGTSLGKCAHEQVHVLAGLAIAFEDESQHGGSRLQPRLHGAHRSVRTGAGAATTKPSLRSVARAGLRYSRCTVVARLATPSHVQLLPYHVVQGVIVLTSSSAIDWPGIWSRMSGRIMFVTR